MDLFKNLGEKAKQTAKVVGEKSSDIVESGKLKMQISQLENEIRRLKTDIGQFFYEAYTEASNLPNEEIVSICEEIKERYQDIEVLKEKIERL